MIRVISACDVPGDPFHWTRRSGSRKVGSGDLATCGATATPKSATAPIVAIPTAATAGLVQPIRRLSGVAYPCRVRNPTSGIPRPPDPRDSRRTQRIGVTVTATTAEIATARQEATTRHETKIHE